jgi:hypothetical protein
LKKFWIDINEAWNGVFLPHGKYSCEPTCRHVKIHTDKYKEMVFNKLKNSTSKEDVYYRLNQIRNELLNEWQNINY